MISVKNERNISRSEHYLPTIWLFDLDLMISASLEIWGFLDYYSRTFFLFVYSFKIHVKLEITKFTFEEPIKQATILQIKRLPFPLQL